MFIFCFLSFAIYLCSIIFSGRTRFEDDILKRMNDELSHNLFLFSTSIFVIKVDIWNMQNNIEKKFGPPKIKLWSMAKVGKENILFIHSIILWNNVTTTWNLCDITTSHKICLSWSFIIIRSNQIKSIVSNQAQRTI